MSFWAELKRRNVFKVAAAYLVASWLIVQVIGVLTDPLRLPAVLDTVVVVLLAIGFPVALLAAWAFELTPEGIRRESEVSDTAGASRVTGQRLNLIVTILLAAVVVVLLVERYQAVGEPLASQAETSEQSPVAASSYRLAVLPMRSLSTSDEDRIFAQGLTSVMIDQLDQIDAFDVASETSILVYESRPESAETIADELQVDYLLEMNMRVDTERIIVSARLLSVRESALISLGTFDRLRGELFALQDDIAEAVTDELSQTLGVASATSERGTDDPYAYIAWMRGRAHVSHFRPAEAVEAFSEAIDLDEEFAEAWLALADAYGLFFSSSPEIVEEYRELRAAAIETALELDPELVDPDVIEAREHDARSDRVAAARSWNAAIERNRANRIDISYAGGHLVQVGRVAEAAAIYLEGRDSSESNALSAFYTGQVAWALDLIGRNEEALTEFERSMELNDGQIVFFIQHFHALLSAPEPERFERFRGAISANLPLIPELAEVWDSPPAATAILREGLADSSGIPLVALAGFSVFAAHYGEVELALDFLREGYSRERVNSLVYMWHPLMSEVRRMPEFKALIVELGLDEYWREIAWGDLCRPLGDDDFECD